MAYDTTYIVLPLKRCGLWDEALAILPSDATALRAELLTDRFWWRLDGQAEAEQAVAALRCRHPRGGTSTRGHRARPPAADRRCDRP